MAQNDTTRPELKPAQRRAIAALLSARNITAAAKDAGVSRRSLVRWMEDPVFLAALAAAENEALGVVTRSLLMFAQPAVLVLAQNMTDKTATPAARNGAAGQILSNLLGYRTHLAFDDRLRAIEEALYANGKDN